MVSPATPNSTSQPQASGQHQYGTRIRNNSVIRPSARLRQSPDFSIAPRKIKPVPTSKSAAIASEQVPLSVPVFPPEHIVLHSDDATSKVFLAIGRALMSAVCSPYSWSLIKAHVTEPFPRNFFRITVL